MKNLYLIQLLLFILVLSGCKDKEQDEPVIILYPESLYIQAFNNEKLIFNIQVFSDYRLTEFIITQKFAGEQEITILDSVINLLQFSYQWGYQTPADIEEDIYLYFKATNEKGYQTVTGRKIVFTGKRLQEFTGLKMYSVNSGNAAAFNLATLQALPLSADSTVRDLQELQADTLSTKLSMRWMSPSECEFAYVPGYDYGNASSSTARNAFIANIKYTELSNIKVNDIYIVKIHRLAPDEVYVVVKITSLVDVDGTKNDWYEFSVKK